MSASKTLGIIQGHLLSESRLGRLARECWIAIPDHFARVKLDEFVLMPNHLHGLLIFYPAVGAQHCCARSDPPRSEVKPGSLAAVVRSFKAIVSRRAHEELGWRGPIWQRNYYERIVRNGEEFREMQRYVVENPLRWECDKDNPG